MFHQPINRLGALTLLLLIALLAAWLRLKPTGESLWVDELHTAWTVSAGLGEIPGRAAMGNYSPLYFYLPWATTRLLGMSEAALRLPSLLAGAALVALVYGAVVRWTESRAAALLAALLAAVDPNFIYFAGEARAYALVQLVGLAQVMLFWQLVEKDGRIVRAGFVACTVGLFYLHYTTVLLVAAEVVCYAGLLVWRRKALAHRWWQWSTDLAIAAVFCLPAVGHLAEVASRRHNWEMFVGHQGAVAMLRGGRGEMFPLDIYVLLPGGLWLAVVLVRRLTGRRPLVRPVDSRLVLLACCWLLAPVGIAWVLTNTDVARIFLRRYVIASAVAPIVMTALICAMCPTRVWRVATAVAFACVVCAVWWQSGALPSLWKDGRPLRGENWRGAVRRINRADRGKHWPALVRSGLIEADALTGDGSDAALREYCLLPVTGIYRLDTSDRELIPLRTTGSGRLTERQLSRIVQSGGAWLILRGDRQTTQHIVADVLAGLGRQGAAGRVEMFQPYGQVQVVGMSVSVVPARPASSP